jgi:hypothetical protein
MTAIRPTTTTVPPAPRSVILLVAAIALAGVPVGFVNEPTLTLILYLPNVCIGALLVIRRPRNLIGWLLIGMGWAFVGGFAPVPATIESFRAGTASPLAILITWWSSWSWFVAFALYLVIMVIFPAGHLPTGRWHRPAAAAIAAASFAVVLLTLAPTIDVHPRDGSSQTLTIASPLSFLPDQPPWSWLTKSQPLAVLVVLCLLVGGAASMVVRLRRARGLERQQLRWMVAALAAVTAALAFNVALSAIFGDAVPAVALLLVVVAFPLPAVAIGVGVLRYRLYEIDRIVSRTIAYAIVSTITAIVFGAIIVVLSTALASFSEGPTIAVTASTLTAFAVFQPVLRRVRQWVDRRFNRARYDAERTVAAFSFRMRDEVDIAAVTGDLRATIQSAVHPASQTLWLREAKP